MEEQFTLKWNNYQNNFASGFHDLLIQEAMIDVTLAAEGKYLQAHKIVLSVCSSYFKDLFKINPCQHPIVILKDVHHQELSDMLDFMYKGEAFIKHENLSSFLKLAENLQVKGLDGDKHWEKQLKPTQSSYFSSDRESDYSPKKVRIKRTTKRRFSAAQKNTEQNKTKTKRRKRQKSETESESDDPLAQLLGTGKPSSELVKSEFDENSADNERDNSPDAFDQLSNDPTPVVDDNTEPMPQGGVDYQMIQTKRGRDMLLYDGFTFTQNRMCKDGMRWQCSYPKCKAFCRMSSAGWLTPYKTNHDHEKPTEEEIRRRILRMELKARAQSSGATPGEIIRNALPAEEYQSTDQKACYTRCIQRFRKSLQRKTCKPHEENDWLGKGGQGVEVPPSQAPPPPPPPLVPAPAPPTQHSTDGPWLQHHKQGLLKEDQKHPMQDSMWQPHPEHIPLSEEEKQRQLEQQRQLEEQRQIEEHKNNMHSKLGHYVL